MIEVELRRDNPMGDYEAVAVQGFSPMVEIVAYSEESYQNAVSRLLNALDELAIPGTMHIDQRGIRIKR